MVSYKKTTILSQTLNEFVQAMVSKLLLKETILK